MIRYYQKFIVKSIADILKSNRVLNYLYFIFKINLKLNFYFNDNSDSLSHIVYKGTVEYTGSLQAKHMTIP